MNKAERDKRDQPSGAIHSQIARMRAVLVRSLNAWIDHRASSKGAALAFYTLFSMTPILILAIAAAGYFFGAEAAQVCATPSTLFDAVQSLFGGG